MSPELLNAAVESRGIEAERTGRTLRPLDVPARILERPEDQYALGVDQLGRRRIAFAVDPSRSTLRVSHGALVTVGESTQLREQFRTSGGVRMSEGQIEFAGWQPKGTTRGGAADCAAGRVPDRQTVNRVPQTASRFALGN